MAEKRLPAGMRNNNPGNIKYVGQKGTTPSVNTDQGDPQAVYPTADAGMAAMYQLLQKKYRGGKLTPNQMIAGNMGWTPGNYQAAANVARTMGIGPDDDIRLADPASAGRFMRALMLQEHGEASKQYTDAQIAAAISASPPPQGGFTVNTQQPRGGPVEAAGGGSRNEAAGPQVLPMYQPDGKTPIVPSAPAGGAETLGGQMPVIATKPARKNLAEMMADAMGRMGGGGQSQLPALPSQPAAARVDAPTLGTTQMQRNDLQRQMLAYQMQKLNSGKLWG